MVKEQDSEVFVAHSLTGHTLQSQEKEGLVTMRTVSTVVPVEFTNYTIRHGLPQTMHSTTIIATDARALLLSDKMLNFKS